MIIFVGGKAGIRIPHTDIQGIRFIDTFAHFNDRTNGHFTMVGISDIIDGDFGGPKNCLNIFIKYN